MRTILSKNKITYTVSRYINIKQYWYLYSLDGICFSFSQKIKLIGVGLFGSHENKIINATLKILDGPSTMSNTIYEENVEIAPSANKFGAITKIFLFTEHNVYGKFKHLNFKFLILL